MYVFLFIYFFFFSYWQCAMKCHYSCWYGLCSAGFLLEPFSPFISYRWAYRFLERSFPFEFIIWLLHNVLCTVQNVYAVCLVL